MESQCITCDEPLIRGTNWSAFKANRGEKVCSSCGQRAYNMKYKKRLLDGEVAPKIVVKQLDTSNFHRHNVETLGLKRAQERAALKARIEAQMKRYGIEV